VPAGAGVAAAAEAVLSQAEGEPRGGVRRVGLQDSVAEQSSAGEVAGALTGLRFEERVCGTGHRHQFFRRRDDDPPGRDSLGMMDDLAFLSVILS
jgi:hypothetical protein